MPRAGTEGWGASGGGARRAGTSGSSSSSAIRAGTPAWKKQHDASLAAKADKKAAERRAANIEYVAAQPKAPTVPTPAQPAQSTTPPLKQLALHKRAPKTESQALSQALRQEA